VIAYAFFWKKIYSQSYDGIKWTRNFSIAHCNTEIIFC